MSTRRQTVSLPQILQARDMIEYGYTRPIVALQLGLSYKQLRNITSNLGMPVRKAVHHNPGTRIKHLFRTPHHRISVSILMAAYYRYGGQQIYRSVDMTALREAQETLKRICLDIADHSPDGTQLRECPQIAPADAWGLAVEIRSGNAELATCPQCRAIYYDVAEHISHLHACPYCSTTPASVPAKPATVRVHASNQRTAIPYRGKRTKVTLPLRRPCKRLGNAVTD